MQPVDVDVPHLLAEHRAACDELRRLRTALERIASEDFTGSEPESRRLARQALANNGLTLPEYRPAPDPVDPPRKDQPTQ